MSQYITEKQCQPLTQSSSYIFMHSKHRLKSVWHMPSDPGEGFYGVMSSRPIVINELPHSSACLSINFEGASVMCPHSSVP